MKEEFEKETHCEKAKKKVLRSTFEIETQQKKGTHY